MYFDQLKNTVGLMKSKDLISAIASGIDNPVFIVGSSTGRDGIHGATFASEELTEETESKKSNVQVGDPFTEKLLLEASLEFKTALFTEIVLSTAPVS